jgi:2-amino-4-hydroxy-6-hydroxymethyldihydropteridine diphosphokinase
MSINTDVESQFAAIGLGGNLGDAPKTLCFALEQLAAHAQIHIIAISHLYRSAAIGPEGQPDYANAVISISTSLSPIALLDALQAIELMAGRERLLRWGARTLDLDILLYGEIAMQSERLTIPHIELYHRPFVLVPLADIAAERVLPNGHRADELAASCSRDGLALWPDLRWPSTVE